MRLFANIIKKWGVLLLILALPFYLIRFKIFGIPSTFLEVLFWVVFIFWFSANFETIKQNLKSKISNQKSQIKKYPFSFFIILFVLASFIGLAVAGFSNEALGIYKAYFLEAILFYILVFNYFKKEENREKVFLSLFLSAFFISLYAIYQKLTGNYWSGGVNELRVTGVFPYPNALGLYLGPIVVLAFFYFINRVKDGCPIVKKEKLINLFVFITFFISLYSIYLARSEAALGAVLASIFIGALFISKRFALIFILLGILGGGIIFSNEKLKTFTLEKIQLKDFSGEVRKQQWRETSDALKNNLNYISGCGLSGYQSCVGIYHQEGIFFNSERDPDFRRKIVLFDEKYKAEHWRPVEIYMYPHNIFLNFWVELGIIGVVAVIGLLIQFFYFGVVLMKTRGRIIIIGLISVMLEILIHGMVDVPYFKNDLSFLWWFIFAIIAVYWVESREVKSVK